MDLLLTHAALGVLNRVNPGGGWRRWPPRLAAGRTRNLLGELAPIAADTSLVRPSRRDERFADPGWASKPLLRHAMQACPAAAHTAEGTDCRACSLGAGLPNTHGLTWTAEILLWIRRLGFESLRARRATAPLAVMRQPRLLPVPLISTVTKHRDATRRGRSGP